MPPVGQLKCLSSCFEREEGGGRFRAEVVGGGQREVVKGTGFEQRAGGQQRGGRQQREVVGANASPRVSSEKGGGRLVSSREVVGGGVMGSHVIALCNCSIYSCVLCLVRAELIFVLLS